MPDISALSQISLAAVTLNNLIIVTPNEDAGIQPQNPDNKFVGPRPQPETLLFNYQGENTLTLTSEVTDHFMEDNKSTQDQIALKPLSITVSGFIGELNDVVPKPLKKLKQISDKLVITSGYLPQLSIAALEAYNTAKQIYDLGILVSERDVSKYTSQPNKTKQQAAFEQFYGYWGKRTLFTVQTPWGIFKDCAILNLKAVQSGETRMVSEFEITFKPLQFADTKRLSAEQYEASNAEGRASDQTATEVKIGPTTPVESTTVGEGLTSVQN